MKTKYDRTLKELEVTTSLMQDTGEAIWLINAAYLVALTVLLTLLVGGAFPPEATQLELWGSFSGGLLGCGLCWFWAASFERNYGFYILRINISRILEEELFFKTLTLGKTLSDKGIVQNEKGETLGQISWIGRTPKTWGIQKYTRGMICIFASAFVGVVLVATGRLLGEDRVHYIIAVGKVFAPFIP